MLGFIRKRDIAGGDMSYGEYIQLCRVLSQENADDIQICQQLIKTLHNKDIGVRAAKRLLPYAKEIAEGIIAWVQREKDECSVPPTNEQIAAGLDKLSKEVGDMGGVVAISQQMGMTFEQVYNLPYVEVFTLNKVESARIRYERRYTKVLERKSKHG